MRLSSKTFRNSKYLEQLLITSLFPNKDKAFRKDSKNLKISTSLWRKTLRTLCLKTRAWSSNMEKPTKIRWWPVFRSFIKKSMMLSYPTSKLKESIASSKLTVKDLLPFKKGWQLLRYYWLLYLHIRYIWLSGKQLNFVSNWFQVNDNVKTT